MHLINPSPSPTAGVVTLPKSADRLWLSSRDPRATTLRQPKRFRPVGENSPVLSQDRSDSPFSNLFDYEHASGNKTCGRAATEISSVHAALKIRAVALICAIQAHSAHC
jgi:hypothetical protein